jgi:hypothetical protein
VQDDGAALTWLDVWKRHFADVRRGPSNVRSGVKRKRPRRHLTSANDPKRIFTRVGWHRLSSKLHLRMFRMYKGGKLEDLTLERTLMEYSEEQRALTKAAGAFGLVVKKLWNDL